MTVFNDPLEVTIEDKAHSLDEDRFLSLGTSEAGGLLVGSYTERQSERNTGPSRTSARPGCPGRSG